MKILFFAQIFYPVLYGGGEYIFYQWAVEMAKRGHDIFVITQRLGNTIQYEEVNGIKIFRVGSSPNLVGTLPTGIKDNLSFLTGAFLKGIQIVRENKIDVIHSNTYVPAISGQMCATLLRKPHIVTVHDVYYTSEKDFWKQWSYQAGSTKSSRLLGPILEKMVLKLPVRLFHTVSEKSKSDMIELGVSKKIIVIPNGLNPDQYERANIFPDNNQAIYVGRLIFYKNVDTIITAFSNVIKKIPDAKLIIVGDGPVKNDLIKKSQSLGLDKNIIFTGNISDDEKIRLIYQSRVLLNPSLIEGFGIVVIEGFACGRPVIVSDSKPLSDLVNNGVDGFIVPAFDANEWSNKIIEIFSDPIKAEEKGKAGKEKTISNYSISGVVSSLLELYKSVKVKS